MTNALSLQKLNLFLTRIRQGRTFLPQNDVMTKRGKEDSISFPKFTSMWNSQQVIFPSNAKPN